MSRYRLLAGKHSQKEPAVDTFGNLKKNPDGTDQNV